MDISSLLVQVVSWKLWSHNNMFKLGQISIILSLKGKSNPKKKSSLMNPQKTNSMKNQSPSTAKRWRPIRNGYSTARSTWRSTRKPARKGIWSTFRAWHRVQQRLKMMIWLGLRPSLRRIWAILIVSLIKVMHQNSWLRWNRRPNWRRRKSSSRKRLRGRRRSCRKNLVKLRASYFYRRNKTLSCR